MFQGILTALTAAFVLWFLLAMLLVVLYFVSSTLVFIGSNIIPILVIAGIFYFVYKRKK